MAEVLTYDARCNVGPYIAGIDFEVMDPDEIESYSTVGVTSTHIYSRNVPAACGISDIRMGTCDRNLRCGTCGNSVRRCPGHCGHIELPQPVLHMAMVDHMLKLLRSVCFLCGRCRSVTPPPVPDAKATFAASYAACKGRRRCVHCDAAAVQITKHVGGLKATLPMDVEDPSQQAMLEQPLTPACILDILSILTPETLVALGIDPQRWRPEALVFGKVLVPPPIVRPSVTNESKSRGQVRAPPARHRADRDRAPRRTT